MIPHTQGGPSTSSTKLLIGLYLTNDIQFATEKRVIFLYVWVSCAVRMVQAIYKRKKTPKNGEKRLGKNTVSRNCKTAIKMNVVVFTFATTRISKLIYTALFNKCLACKPCKKVF